MGAIESIDLDDQCLPICIICAMIKLLITSVMVLLHSVLNHNDTTMKNLAA